MRPEEYLKAPYTRILVPEQGGGYAAEILEFPGCFADGKSADEAMKNLDQAALAWIKACDLQHQEVPKPFSNQGFGGKFALRLPRSLHRQIARMAERDRVSTNQFIVAACAAKVGVDETYQRLLELHSRIQSSVTIYATSNVVNVMAAQLHDASTGADHMVATAATESETMPMLRGIEEMAVQ